MDKIDESVVKVISLIKKLPSNYFEDNQRVPYYNMPATITDAILQAGMNYKRVVYPRICNILTKYADYKTTCDFIILFQTYPIEKIINWKNINKQNTICELAWFLYNNNINDEKQLAVWLKSEINQESLLKIKGVGYKTIDYLKLLSGQQSIPVDRHMFQFLEMANVITKSYREASMVLKKAAEQLKLSESLLDKILWNYMSEKNNQHLIVHSLEKIV